ncbi:MAG TPA: class I SAM-dependent methyltransferase [Phycisphaerales bacterium]|nr:class I SAM-dependent methyltransferase [Phycisphaerales bacterium]
MAIAAEHPGKFEAPREMAIPGTHDAVMRVLARHLAPSSHGRVLDVGAGAGALSLKMHKAGYKVSACDLVPDIFRCVGIECREVDAHGVMPFENNQFDAVVAIELVEHLDGHRKLFSEAARVLKPGGFLLFSTPNILSLKSRIMFLFTGYFYSFPPLDPTVDAPISQHIASFTLDRYRFMLGRCGLKLDELTTDKMQGTSMAWGWLWPLIKLFTRMKYGGTANVREQNSTPALFGRKLMVVARKP